MGQVSCRNTIRKSHTVRKRARFDTDTRPRGNSELYEYNNLLTEELSLSAEAIELSRRSQSPETLERFDSIFSHIGALSEKRLHLEDHLLLLDIMNDFTSFSPGRYRFENLLGERPSLSENVTSLDQLANSKTTITRLELLGPDCCASKLVLVEKEDLSLIRIIRAACYSFSDIAHCCDVSSQLGRFVFYDFSRHPEETDSCLDQDKPLLVRLMIHHLSCVFQFSVVGGIPFIPIPVTDIRFDYVSSYQTLNDWVGSCLQMTTIEMLHEFVRLMQIGFKINAPSTTVFVFAGVDSLVESNEFLRYLVNQVMESCSAKCMFLVGGKDISRLEDMLTETCPCTITKAQISQFQSHLAHVHA
jgi:hypothetical protein